MKTKVSSLIRDSIIAALVAVFILAPLGKYVYSKTIGKDDTDCMVRYVQDYYPNGELYLIEGQFNHIDKRGIANPYMKSRGLVDGCLPNVPDYVSVVNIPYCYWTLVLEGKVDMRTGIYPITKAK